VVVELKREIVDGKGEKEEEGSRPVTNHWPTGHAWPPLNPYFHPPLHLAPIILLFIYFKFLDFILCNDEINMLWKREKNKKWWMKGGEIKIKYANCGRRAENEM
jgi:hypothetical protein